MIILDRQCKYISYSSLIDFITVMCLMKVQMANVAISRIGDKYV
ncbi:hypothetical protein SAMN06265347_103129 [Halobellus salinus]|nr:hypothetical protein SAMN06265347_103129 [Halobellus salinus]